MTFTQKLQVLLENAVKQVAGEIGFVLPDNIQVKLERPRDPKHGDWATNIAMQLAKKMIQETDDKFIVIAEKVGYNDVSYFSKCFKKYFGISPKECR